MHKMRGNILFLILLAIVLFAGLAYAVTQSLRGGGKDASNEKNDAFAAQLMQNMSLIENTMGREIVLNDTKPWGFDVSGKNSSATANSTCINVNCRLFAGNSQINQGLPLINIPVAYTTSGVEESPIFFWIQIENVATSAEDVTVTYNNVSLGLCEAINRGLGYTDIDLTQGESVGGSAGRIYSGTQTAAPNASARLGEPSTGLTFLRGKRGFCYKNSSNYYVFTYVLIQQ